MCIVKRATALLLLLAVFSVLLCSCALKDKIQTLGMTDAERMQRTLERCESELRFNGQIQGELQAQTTGEGATVLQTVQETFAFENRGKETMKASFVRKQFDGTASAEATEQAPLYFEDGELYLKAGDAYLTGTATADSVEQVMVHGYSYFAYVIGRTVIGKTPFSATQDPDSKNWTGVYDVPEELFLLLGQICSVCVDLTADGFRRARMTYEVTAEGLPVRAELSFDGTVSSMYGDTSYRGIAVKMTLRMTYSYGANMVQSLSLEDYRQVGAPDLLARAVSDYFYLCILPQNNIDCLSVSVKDGTTTRSGFTCTGAIRDHVIRFEVASYSFDGLGNKQMNRILQWDGTTLTNTDLSVTETEVLSKEDATEAYLTPLVIKAMVSANLLQEPQDCMKTERDGKTVLVTHLSDDDARGILNPPEGEEWTISAKTVTYTLGTDGYLKLMELNVQAKDSEGAEMQFTMSFKKLEAGQSK